MIEGNKLHERLKKTLMRNVPSYIDKSGNFMVASVSLIASNATSSRVFTQPISVHFESNYCNECFTDSSVYDVDPQNVERHIHQRLDVANSFYGIFCHMIISQKMKMSLFGVLIIVSKH